MRLGAVLAAITLVVAAGASATAAPKAYSTDGEATVYLDGDFRGDFELVYDARMLPMPANRSWSVLNVTLLGGPPPSDAVSIGLFPQGDRVHVYAATTRHAKMVFRDTGVACAGRCRLGLHGSAAGFVATADGRVVGSWPRYAFSTPAPAVQLNAETSAAGDRLDAELAAVRTTARGRSLASPTCAFTTRGIEVRATPTNALRYTGMFDEGARVAYFSLAAPATGREACGT